MQKQIHKTTGDQQEKEIAANRAKPLQDNRSETKAQLKRMEQKENGKKVIQTKSPKNGLPEKLKGGIEQLSGMSMDGVKVHYNSQQPAQVNAHAFAQGTDIHLAPGQEKHLAHEAWHVVQQKQGRVKPTIHVNNKVPVNDDKNLENEADIMGRKATTQNHRKLTQLITKTSSDTITQRKEIDAGIIGLTHLVQAKEGSIFEGADFLQVEHGTVLKIDTTQKLRSRRGPNQEINTEADRNGEQNYRWFKVLAVNNHPVPDNVYVRSDTINVNNETDIVPSSEVGHTREREGGGLIGGQVGGLSPQDQERWNSLGKYLQLTVGAVEAAPIRKDSHFNVDALRGNQATTAAAEYIEQFQVISKQAFQSKISEIALGIMRVGTPYSCIVSEVGKSNLWLTGKVLDQVRRMGGAPPKKIISLPVQEKGAMDRRVDGMFSRMMIDAGHIVFIDDGSYSGNQLVKLINSVIGNTSIPHSIGLIASSGEADHKLLASPGAGRGAPLATPYPIGTYSDSRLLDAAYRALKIPVHHDNPDNDRQPPDGNALAALHYKIPDYASVREKLLTGKNETPGPIVGYRKGIEPYKSAGFMAAIEAAGGLAGLGIENPLRTAPRSAMPSSGLLPNSEAAAAFAPRPKPEGKRTTRRVGFSGLPALDE